VRHKTRAVKGRVLEVDRGVVYLEADNGVEMQFAVGDLEADVPPAVPIHAAPSSEAKDAELLARIPESVVGLAAVRYARDPSSRRNGWADAGAREKLDWVAKASGLTREQLAQLVRAGKARQIEAHAAVSNRR
jgi:hypothetical protein